jgi:hypothetical protein
MAGMITFLGSIDDQITIIVFTILLLDYELQNALVTPHFGSRLRRTLGQGSPAALKSASPM